LNDDDTNKASESPKLFFSLKWKTLAIISLVFALAFVILSYIIYTEGTRLFQNQIAESIRNNSTALLWENRRNLIEIGTSISLMSKGPESENSKEGLIKYLDNNWDLMELEWGLESLLIYDLATEESLFWGLDNKLNIKDFLQRDTAKGPSTRIICTDRCSIYAKVPMFFISGEKKYLFIGAGLVDFILNFAHNNQLKAALVRPQQGKGKADDNITPWGMQIAGMTDRKHYFPIVRQLSQEASFEEVKQEGKIIVLEDNTHYYLYAIALQQDAENTDYLLLANDISTEKQRVYDTMINGGIITLISLLSAVVLIFYVLNDPMRRIQQQAKLLPLLAKKKFEEVREKTNQNTRHRFIHNELDVLENTAVELSTELEKLHKEIEIRAEELERMALYDVLTGLANRRMFVEQLNALIKNAQKHTERFGVVFIDLDNFKRINDTLGHDIGDELLIEVSNRLKTAVRDTDVVARLGGDEFTLLLPQLKSLKDAKLALDKVLEQFQRPVVLNKNDYKITPSIGAAIGPDNGVASEDLMRCADMAMYKAKRNGKNCYFFFTNEMNDALQKEIKLEGELLDAIDAREFRLYYQPIVDLSSGKVVGVEALLGWLHPQRGLLAPFHFIDMLENNGQIVALGSQIFELACLGKLYLNHFGLEDIRVSLNVSAKQFNDPLLLDKLQDALDTHNINPDAFQIEITEQTLMTNIEKQAKTIRHLQEIGFKIAIDDFGTGYSSLAYLKELPLDTLKIDRSFIKDIPYEKNDMEIVSAVTAMAKKINIKVVAEGIEIQDHEEFLKKIECEFGQGYLYSKPESISKIVAYCKAAGLL